MNKKLLSISAIFVLFIAAIPSLQNVTITIPTNTSISLQCESNSVISFTNILSNSVNVLCEESLIPTSTNTPIPTEIVPTETLVILPTNTNTTIPTETFTVVPTKTNTVTPTNTKAELPTITPTQLAVVDYPLCENHDVNSYHALINEKDKCHFDHQHGDNPNNADDIFGKWKFGENTISYPHASSPIENMYNTYIMSNTVDLKKKHAGYFYLVDKNIPLSPVDRPNWYAPVDNSVTDVRAQIHFWNEGDTKVRFHSSYYEIRVQNRITGKYGIVKVGGLFDTGILQLYKQQWLPVIGQDPDFNTYKNYMWYPMYNDPQSGKTIGNYRGYKASCEQLQTRFWNPLWWSPTYNRTYSYTSLSSDVLWSAELTTVGYNKIAGISIEKYDAPDCIGNVSAPNLTNPYSSTYNIFNICDLGNQPNCRFNGTEVVNFMTYVFIPKEWDNKVNFDTNSEVGIVSYKGSTNNKQEIIPTCLQAAYDCIPFELIDMPIGTSFWQNSGNGRNLNGQVIVKDFDTTPTNHLVNGKWESWIRQ